MEENRVEGRREFQMMQSSDCDSACSHAQLQSQMDQMEELSGSRELCHVTTLTANPRTPIYCGRSMSMVLQDARQHDFTREERGRVTQVLSKKVGLNCIATLVRAGFTAQVAIDRIYQVYGENATVTTIINRMKQDRQAGIVHQSRRFSVFIILVLVQLRYYCFASSYPCIRELSLPREGGTC
jgi:hypothetical protein